MPLREGNEKESVDCRTTSLGSWATDAKAGGGDGGSSFRVAKNDEPGDSLIRALLHRLILAFSFLDLKAINGAVIGYVECSFLEWREKVYR